MLPRLFAITLVAIVAGPSYGSQITCPPTLTNPGVPSGWTAFLPSQKGRAVDPNTVQISEAMLEAPEFYVGNPRFSAPLRPSNARDESGDQWRWFGGRGRRVQVACRYAGTELRVYRTLNPPQNACSAPRQPAADGSLTFSCRAR